MREALDAGSLNLPELPADWNYKAVSEIGAAGEQPVLTGPFGTNLGRGDFVPSGVPVLTIGCLTQGGINLDKALFISEDKAQELSRYRLKEGDLLFSRMASVGRAGLVTKQLEGALFNYHIMRLRLDEERVDARFFINYVRGAKQVRDYLKAVNHGATRDGINTEQLLGLPVAVAPPDKQRKIVAEIDKQFSRLDEAVANLQRVKANLKRYKAAVLHSVTSGSLASEAGIPIQANRWTWLTIEELASKEARSIQSGPFGSNLKHSEFQSTGKLVIGIDNVQDGRFSLGSNHRISAEKFAELVKYKARPRDVLITVMATVGRVCVLPDDIEDAIITKHVYRITVNPGVALPEYVGIALRGSSEVRAQLMDSVQGQTRPGLNGGLIKKIRVPVPPLNDQANIVAEVDRQLSILRGVETEVDANLRRAQALRQSVLAKSFQ